MKTTREGTIDLPAAYIALMQFIQKTVQHKDAHGIGGMWTPEESRESEDLILRTYSAGYEHQIASRKFGFEIWEGYTYDKGSQVSLSRGTEADVERCLKYYKITL